MPWRRIATFLWLLLILACTGMTVQRFANAPPLETDLLTLLPATERNPNAEVALRELNAKLGNRVFLLIGGSTPQTARRAADEFTASLRASGAFRQLIDTVPPVDTRWLQEFYAPLANGLISSADQEALNEPEFSPDAALQKRLFQPFVTGIPTDPRHDPYGLLQRWLSNLPLRPSSLNIADGRLVATDGLHHYVVIIAEPQGSAFDSANQHAVVRAITVAESSVRPLTPDLIVLRTGSIFYGERARSQAEAEVDLIGGGSLLGIALLIWMMFRSTRPLLLGIATVATGIICGMATVLLVDGRIHLITLVFGASLIGEAVDYSIQYFSTHLDAGQDWEPKKGLRKILPGLAIALSTSLIGYAALSLTPFPAIRQIALFAFVGLSGAWLSVVLLLPLGMHTPSRRDVEQLIDWPRRILRFWREKARPGLMFGLIGGIILLSIPGVMRVTADDDVRTLVTRPADLIAQESKIRQLVGMSGSGRFFITEGDTTEDLLQREEALVKRLRPHLGNGFTSYSATSNFVPSRLSQEASRTLLRQKLSTTITGPLFVNYGFPDEVFSLWKNVLNNENYLELEDWLTSPLSTPFRHLTLTLPDNRTALLLTIEGDEGRVDFASLAADLPGITFVDKAGSVSSMFAEYRRLTSWWIPIACLVIFGILALRYGWQIGAAILLPTLLGLVITLAIHGYNDVPMTLFSIMGLMLVLGVGVNYAIFIVEAGDRAPAPFAGVLLSAATTILSFGLLALSSMPALHQFGFALMFGITASVLLAPLSLVLARRKPS